MTAARQERKRATTIGLGGAGLAAAFGAWMALAMPPVPPGVAATTERIVVDRHTGLAISGFDPVAYFTDGRAVPGKPDLELRLAGATWRFVNPGNLAAFEKHPNVFTPRFGGYDPVAVTRDAATPGHPALWVVAGDRLYLFYNEKSRATFVSDTERTIQVAERRWPIVLRTLSP